MSTRRRKAPWEYSTNRNTIRARARKSRLTPYQREVEQAKASDQKAVTRAWKMRVETETFKMANEDDRKLILDNVEKEVMDRRRQKGLDADTKIARFMQRMMHGAAHPNGKSPSPAGTELSDPDLTITTTTPTSATRGLAPAPSPSIPTPSFRSLPDYPVPPSIYPPYPHAHHHHHSQNSNIENKYPVTSYHLDQNDGPHHNLRPIPQIQHDYPDEPLQPSASGPSTAHAYVQAPPYRDLAAADQTNADLQAELGVSRDHIRDLKRQVDVLNTDLSAARSSVAALEARLREVDSRVAVYDDAGTFRRVVLGVRAIADVAAEVADGLGGDGDGDVGGERDEVDGKGKRKRKGANAVQRGDRALPG
ncbi:hypothetical protein F4779DRAFT_276432 [Xylariaceae sp. FL0662B]|nr:hypothetical protein F4779DRAFT_276432 [Xylariaceae sp. FL0662B]